jgi:hypothetical protein
MPVLCSCICCFRKESRKLLLIIWPKRSDFSCEN